MKKILSVIIFIIIISICTTVYAAGGTATINGNNSVTVGSNIVFTVNVSGCSDASSVAVNVYFGNNFEFVSAEWLKGGMINNPYDANTGKGALGGLSSADINGNIYSITLKAKTANANPQIVKIGVIAKNGSNEIFNNIVSKSVKINCATHSYGDWIRVDQDNHKHTCLNCGNVETNRHSWNSGKITKNASCKETGNKKYTCTICGEIKNDNIAKTNDHNFGNWITTQSASCVGTGTKTRTCSICQQIEMATISATGHAFSNPVVTKQPTCTETGVESGKCSHCGQITTNTIKANGHSLGMWGIKTSATCVSTGVEERKCCVCTYTETRNTEALGHDFENPTIVKEATLTTTGLKEGKCKRCNEITSEIIPCSATDEISGTEFRVEEGVFQEGTTMKIEKIEENTLTYENAKSALKEITNKFVVSNISAIFNNTEVQPNGVVKLTLKVPNEFGDNLAFYHIADDGTIEKLEIKNNDNGTVSTDVTCLGNYVLCDLGTTVNIENDKKTNSERDNVNNIVIFISIGIAAITGVAGAIVIIKKKKLI